MSTSKERKMLVKESGKVGKGSKSEKWRYLNLVSNSKRRGCGCKEASCRHKSKKGGDSSLIGDPGRKDVVLPPSMGSSTERLAQKAMKVEAPNKIMFHCPNCDSTLCMRVTKKQEWDDSDSLVDVKDDWSLTNGDEI